MDMEALSKANTGLIYRIAQRYAYFCQLDRAADLDDLMQAGHIGLWKAAETYDPNGGKTWAGWAAWHIKREMRALLGLASARRRAELGAVSLSAPLDDDDGDTIGDMIADKSLPDACDTLARAEVRDNVRAALDRLPEIERAVIDGHELRGLDFDALADEMGEAAEALKQADRRGIKHMRQDKALRAYWLDLETRFYAHKGVEAFNRDWTSTTEGAALWRIERKEKNHAETERGKGEAGPVGHHGGV